MHKYAGVDDTLRSWFVLFQAKHPEAHISCAGRGYVEQQAKRGEGRSKASYGHSAHNYNCAIDLFVNYPGLKIYDEYWFNQILAPEIPDFLEWYGWPEYKTRKDKYWELPHVEVKNWRDLREHGLVHLVEPMVA